MDNICISGNFFSVKTPKKQPKGQTNFLGRTTLSWSQRKAKTTNKIL